MTINLEGLPPGVARRSGAHDVWVAVPPVKGVEPLLFGTLVEARRAARAGGPGWRVEGRRVWAQEV
jgi:hypothetical protein